MRLHEKMDNYCFLFYLKLANAGWSPVQTKLAFVCECGNAVCPTRLLCDGLCTVYSTECITVYKLFAIWTISEKDSVFHSES